MPNKILTTLEALIIDDETDICYLLSNILKQKKVHSIFAGSLSEYYMLSFPPILYFLIIICPMDLE